jgi:hypothetical protein
VTTYNCTCSFALVGSFAAFVLANTIASIMPSITIISRHCLNFLQIASYKESKQEHQEENTKIKAREIGGEHQKESKKSKRRTLGSEQ